MNQLQNDKAIVFEIGGQQYRIRRYNSMNLVIERQNDKAHHWAKPDAEGWSVYGYYGNSHTLTSGLAQVATEAHTPEDDTLAAQLEALRQAFEDGTAAIVGGVVFGTSKRKKHDRHYAIKMQ